MRSDWSASWSVRVPHATPCEDVMHCAHDSCDGESHLVDGTAHADGWEPEDRSCGVVAGWDDVWCEVDGKRIEVDDGERGRIEEAACQSADDEMAEDADDENDRARDDRRTA